MKHNPNCEKCQGLGAYYMTNCDDEPPIQCDCDETKLIELTSVQEKAIKQAVIAFRDFVDARGVCHDELMEFEKFLREYIFNTKGIGTCV